MQTRTIDALPTPCLLLDRGRLEANCARMRETAARHGVRLRPHLKTAKSLEVTNVALADGARCGAVSTLEEAEHFVARGLTDLTYAVGVTPDKLERVAGLNARGGEVAVLTDDIEAAGAIAARAEALGARFSVWIEVDSGQHRGGVAPGDDALLAVAAALDSEHIDLRGVLTHAGQSYACRSVAEVTDVAEAERSAAVLAAERLRAAGVSCAEISVGSTPTVLHARTLEGVTEVRPGVYMFFDLMQGGLGSCGPEDLALSVLTRVVGRRPADGALWIDAGTLGLSSETLRSEDGESSYGKVTAEDGASLPGAPRVDALNQVHGRVVATRGPLPSLPVGTLLRVWPNHACITAAMYDRYHVVDGREVLAEWPRLRG